jgi:hypothetical protein
VGTANQKMKLIVNLVIALLSILATDAARAAEGRYTRSMFERAVKDTSSPRYVLVQVRDARAPSAQTVCVRGSELVDAVQTEHDWNYAIGGRLKAHRVALIHWREPFVFEKINALAHLQPRYSQKQLAEVREKLSRFTNRQLKSQLRARRRGETELQQIYAGSDAPLAYTSRAAVAHALLERGILVANDERTGQLRLP